MTTATEPQPSLGPTSHTLPQATAPVASGPTLNLRRFERQIEAMRDRAAALSQEAEGLPEPAPTLINALSDLAATIESLQISHEELAIQAEQLKIVSDHAEFERLRYQDLFEGAPDAYVVTDTYGGIREANLAAAELFNVAANRLIGKPLAVYVASGDRATFLSWLIAQRKAHTPEPQQHEFVLVGRGGQEHQVELTATFLQPTDAAPMLRWLIHDITAHKETEHHLRASHDQMAAFAAQVEKVREEERTRVAREVHDDLGQALTALKIEVGLFGQSLPDERPDLHEKMQSILRQIDATIFGMRSIMTNLRPPMLDDIGLVGTIEWQCHDFQTRTGILCRFMSNASQVCVGSDASTALFRLTQELLTNVARHAKATRVTIKLVQTKRLLRLTAQDNGRGITNVEINNCHSSGLMGMRERVRQLHGHIEIRGVLGKGTWVRVEVPCANSIAPSDER